MNSQEYIEVSVRIDPFTEENAEILMAELEDMPFESFSTEEQVDELMRSAHNADVCTQRQRVRIPPGSEHNAPPPQKGTGPRARPKTKNLSQTVCTK